MPDDAGGRISDKDAEDGVIAPWIELDRGGALAGGGDIGGDAWSWLVVDKEAAIFESGDSIILTLALLDTNPTPSASNPPPPSL